MRAMVLRAFLTAAVIAACACAHQAASSRPGASYASVGARVAVETSYRVIVTCAGTELGYGSAVAVSPDTLVTARHVVDAECPVEPTFAALSSRGVEIVVRVGRRHETADLATLVSPGPIFPRWAAIATGPTPLGAELHANVGGSVDRDAVGWSFCYKVLHADRYTMVRGTRVIYLSGPVVAGNSGGAVIDAGGAVVGIIVARGTGPDPRGVAVAATEVGDLLARTLR
jgi:S1-C subfamily serine protease